MAVIQYESDVSVRGRVLINGGLPTQFLKADGSVDSNTYLTSASLPTVDQTIIDGSTNAVSGNAVFDALATKAPLNILGKVPDANLPLKVVSLTTPTGVPSDGDEWILYTL